MNVRPGQMSFAGGELSPLVVYGSIPMELYAIGARELENFLALEGGAIARRWGTHHADDGSTQGNAAAYLVAWIYNNDDVYVLEFTPLKIRVYRSHGLVLSAGVPLEIVTTFEAAELPYLQVWQSGDVMWIKSPSRKLYKLTRASSTSWTLAEASISVGPWLDTNTTAITMTVSATGPELTPCIVTASDSYFTANDEDSYLRIDHDLPARTQKKQFVSVVDDVASLLIAKGAEWTFDVRGTGAADGVIELQYTRDNVTWSTYRTVRIVSAAGLNWSEHLSGSNEEDEPIWLRASCTVRTSGTFETTIEALPYRHSGVIWLSLYTSATQMSGWIEHSPAATTATADWASGALSARCGWGRAIGFHDERIILAGTTSQPLTLHFGKAGDYQNFDRGAEDDDDAMSFTISQSRQHRINWINGDWADTILVGTEGSIVELVPMSEGGFTPTNWPVIHRTVHERSCRIVPQMVDDVMMVPGGVDAKRLFQIFRSNERGGLSSEDLTQWARHISGTGFSGLAVQQDPDQILWLPRVDGVLAGCTFKYGATAWHRQTIGDAVISHCTVPTSEGDELWMCVRRTVGGATKYFVEYAHKVDIEADIEDAFHLDCAEGWNGGDPAAVTVITVANPTVITLSTWPQDSNGVDLADGDYVRFDGYDDLESQIFQVFSANSGAKTLQLKDQAGAVLIDGSAFTAYTTGATLTWVDNQLSGMGHLALEDLKANCDGAEIDVTPSAGGVVSFGEQYGDFYNNILVGIPFTSRFVSMPLEFYTREGSTIGMQKQIGKLAFSLYKSYGGQYGATNGTMHDIKYTRAAGQAATPPVLFTGNKILGPVGGLYQDELNVVIECSGVHPFTLRGVSPELEVG